MTALTIIYENLKEIFSDEWSKVLNYYKNENKISEEKREQIIKIIRYIMEKEQSLYIRPGTMIPFRLSISKNISYSLNERDPVIIIDYSNNEFVFEWGLICTDQYEHKEMKFPNVPNLHSEKEYAHATAKVDDLLSWINQFPINIECPVPPQNHKR